LFSLTFSPRILNDMVRNPMVPWNSVWKNLIYITVVTHTYHLLGYSREIRANVLGLVKLGFVK